MRQRKRYSLVENLQMPADESKVDEAAGVIRDCKLLGRKSLNGREYMESALDDAVQIYEGIKVNIDHPDKRKPNSDRPLKVRLGKFVAVRKQPDGVYADLHYLKSNPLAPMIVEAARRMPDVMGFSHNATVSGYKADDGTLMVESIPAARSLDLVADPATTNGLFESQDMADDMAPAAAAPAAAAGTPTLEAGFGMLLHAAATSADLSDDDRASFIKDLMKMKSKYLGGGEDDAEADDAEAPAEAETAESVGRPAARAGKTGTAKQRLRRMEIKEEMRDLGLVVDEDLVESMLHMPAANVTRQLQYVKKHQRPVRGAPRSYGRQTVNAHEAQESASTGGRRASGDAPPLRDPAKLKTWLEQNSR